MCDEYCKYLLNMYGYEHGYDFVSQNLFAHSIKFYHSIIKKNFWNQLYFGTSISKCTLINVSNILTNLRNLIFSNLIPKGERTFCILP